MNTVKIIKKPSTTSTIEKPCCLKDLSTYIEHETFVYILRSLYRIVVKSGRLKENRPELHKRIKQFEKDSSLPSVISTIPTDKLLSELEDAQYFYPLLRREITLPKFH